VDVKMLNQADAAAEALERAVGQPVVSLLVFSRAYVVRARKRKGVVVISARTLSGHLDQRPKCLSPADVDRLCERLLYACS
jgi:hypothetical protein